MIGIGIGIACIGVLTSLAIGIRFMFCGKYEIEHDDKFLRIRSIGIRPTAWQTYEWAAISKIGYIFKHGTRGVLGILVSGKSYQFGEELKQEDQMKLAEILYKTWEHNRSNDRLVNSSQARILRRNVAQ